MATFERQPPTVKLDGERIRIIREGKALTQLYVAEVVGVTVDTVSRWENNRTAAVRRDNAEALAGALEVALEEIIRAEEAVSPPPAAEAVPQALEAETPPAKPAPRRSRCLIALAIFAIAAAVGTFLWFAILKDGSNIAAQRTLPPYAPPGSLVPVVVKLTLGDGKDSLVVVREKLPPGWTLAGSVPPPDQGPNPDGTVKWIVEVKSGGGKVAYLAKTPAVAKESSRHAFSGEVVGAGLGGGAKPLSGPSKIDLEYVHWADEDADFRIDDSEVLSALDRLEALKTLGLFDPRDLRSLWGAGTYAWDREKGQFVIPGRR